MAIWSRKRHEPRDRHREFIYLDEVSVVSLLASLQGEIKDAVTETLARTEDRSLGASSNVSNTGAGVVSQLGTSRTSTNEVVRRAVVQSTFRDLWRRDTGVLLHDTSGVKRKYRKTLHSYANLEDALPRLKKVKLAAPLIDITRGDIVEMEVKIEADQFFKMITVGTTFLDILDGREHLFGVSTSDLRQVAPMIEVLKELLVGLVPLRGVSSSHCVIEVAGEQVVIATEILGEEVQAGARPIELVGFAEADSFWRDLRRTLFSGSDYTVYARAEGPVLRAPWSPIKVADLLESLSPELRDEIVLPLQQFDLQREPTAMPPDAAATAQFQLANFAAQFQAASEANPDSALVKKAVEAAIPVLASATTTEERRRAFDPVAQTVSGGHVNRELLLDIRSEWIDRQPTVGQKSMSTSSQPVQPTASAVELEVGFVALYW
ncbi:DUF6414 family protein [Dietzia cinnamea]|uniref:DUF6414 family protein n=1 Tax=Dietzia cinnamea TaxID=321318 RepID=UPI00223B9BB9|nr:hypothetical protein [Dietzia cinnamea]MCT2173484.1 hypothetical protein [Dietzia cinnamea]